MIIPIGTNEIETLKAFHLIRPTRILFYFDRIRIWLREPLNSRDRKMLERNCAGLYEESARLGPYRCKIEVYRPSKIGLHTLSRLPDGAMVNYIEVTSDLIMPDAAQLQVLHELFKHGFLQLRHGGKGLKSYEGGFSTRKTPEPGARRGGFWFQWYIDRPCKVTGEDRCFHFEGKYEGRQFVKRLGVYHPRDLKGFDFTRYFKKHLKLYRVDLDRLGRFDDNKRKGAKRKQSKVNDRKLGMALYRTLSAHADQEDRSLQRFVDQYGRGPFLTPVIIYDDHWHKLITSAEHNPKCLSLMSMADL
jgi:hypothetical protein